MRADAGAASRTWCGPRRLLGARHDQGDARLTASNAVNNAISFVLYNEAIYQFVQWFASEPGWTCRCSLYDSVDAYIPTASSRSKEVMAHVCTAIDYKDNDKLLEDHVNHMASNTLRSDGVCVKLVTRPGETLPGVYVEDRNRNVLQTTALDAGVENHFADALQGQTAWVIGGSNSSISAGAGRGGARGALIGRPAW